MSIIHARFEAGVFRPTETIALPEGCHVELHVVTESMQSELEPGEPTQDHIYENPYDESQEDTKGSIEDQLASFAEEVPSNNWQDRPVDLAENLDLYLSGIPQE